MDKINSIELAKQKHGNYWIGPDGIQLTWEIEEVYYGWFIYSYELDRNGNYRVNKRCHQFLLPIYKYSGPETEPKLED